MKRRIKQLCCARKKVKAVKIEKFPAQNKKQSVFRSTWFKKIQFSDFSGRSTGRKL